MLLERTIVFKIGPSNLELILSHARVVLPFILFFHRPIEQKQQNTPHSYT